MRVSWDPRKAKANLLKHGVRFSDAEGALFDPMALTREDERAESESRFVSIGMDHLARLVVVVFSPRGEFARRISARRATRKEQQEYAQRIRF